jgi:hypothetical protein
VYEDVLTGGTLDKPVSLGSVEPLDHAIFLQANFLSDLIKHLQHSPGTPRVAVTIRQVMVDLACFEGGETITPVGLLSVSNNEFMFELDDVMAGIGIECKKNLPAEP